MAKMYTAVVTRPLTDDERWVRMFQDVPTAFWLAPDLFAAPSSVTGPQGSVGPPDLAARVPRSQVARTIMQVMRQRPCPPEGVTIEEAHMMMLAVGVGSSDFYKWAAGKIEMRGIDRVYTRSDVIMSRMWY